MDRAMPDLGETLREVNEFLQDHTRLSAELAEEREKRIRNMEDLIESKVEICRLRRLLHQAGHAFQDRWCVDWKPIFEVMDSVDNHVANDLIQNLDHAIPDSSQPTETTQTEAITEAQVSRLCYLCGANYDAADGDARVLCQQCEEETGCRR